jgi:hypothetical protein
MSKTQDAEFESIWKQVRTVACAAAEKQNAALGPEPQRGFDCGFAWIQMSGTLPFARWAKKTGLASKGYPSGVQIWYSKVHDVPTQSVSVHEVACRVAAHALQRVLGTSEISSGSRLD